MKYSTFYSFEWFKTSQMKDYRYGVGELKSTEKSTEIVKRRFDEVVVQLICRRENRGAKSMSSVSIKRFYV